MHNYLPEIQPGYTEEIFDIAPANSLNLSGDILQSELITDGGNPKVVTMDETPQIIVPLQFKSIEKADRDFIKDLYFNPAKALKTARSFSWVDPDTDNVYTAVFQGGYSENLYTYGLYDVNVTIKLIGKTPIVEDLSMVIFNDDFSTKDTASYSIDDIDYLGEGITAQHRIYSGITIGNISDGGYVSSDLYSGVLISGVDYSREIIFSGEVETNTDGGAAFFTRTAVDASAGLGFQILAGNGQAMVAYIYPDDSLISEMIITDGLTGQIIGFEGTYTDKDPLYSGSPSMTLNITLDGVDIFSTTNRLSDIPDSFNDIGFQSTRQGVPIKNLTINYGDIIEVLPE
jgi:hypothetical protein